MSLYTFLKQQTTHNAAVDFDYPLDDVMPLPVVGDFVKDDKGKTFKVVQIDKFRVGYDVDGTLTEQHGESYFQTEPGIEARVSVVEYYAPGSPQYALYRFYRGSYTIRVA